jgi:hypothetical protein
MILLLLCWVLGHQWRPWERLVVPASDGRILRPTDAIKHIERCARCSRFRTHAWKGNVALGRTKDEVEVTNLKGADS